MDCVTSRFYLGESLDPVDELRVENNIRTLSTRLAHLLHMDPNTHQMCIKVYDRLQVGATTNQSQTEGEGLFSISFELDLHSTSFVSQDWLLEYRITPPRPIRQGT